MRVRFVYTVHRYAIALAASVMNEAPAADPTALEPAAVPAEQFSAMDLFVVRICTKPWPWNCVCGVLVLFQTAHAACVFAPSTMLTVTDGS